MISEKDESEPNSGPGYGALSPKPAIKKNVQFEAIEESRISSEKRSNSVSLTSLSDQVKE